MKLKIDIDLYCKRCGNMLAAKQEFDDVKWIVTVEPCQGCLYDASQNTFESGKKLLTVVKSPVIREYAPFTEPY